MSDLPWISTLSCFGKAIAMGLGIAIAGCSPSPTPEATPGNTPNTAPQTASQTTLVSQAQPAKWQRMSAPDQEQAWRYILNSPMGIAALNQLAIEGFISPQCPKTFYLNTETGGFQSLLRVQCPSERGVSIAQGYNEMRVIFNRFEDNIESFRVERVSPEQPPQQQLPD